MLKALRRSLPWIPFAVVAFGPVLYLIARSFFPNGGPFSVAAYSAILGGGAGAAARRATLWNSLELAFAVVAVTLAVGVPYGFLVARTRLRFAGVYRALAIVPLLLPPYLAGIAWVQVVSMHGLPAIVFLLSSALFPVVALLSAQAFRDVGADAEDAARLSLGEGRALLRVTLPLARGAIAAAALLVFVFALSDFVVPDFFSFAVMGEETFQVFATEVYGAFVRNVDPIGATAFAVPLVAIAGVGLLLLARAEPRRALASLTGSHVAPRPFELGRAAPFAHLFLIAVVALTVAVPLGVLGKMALKQPGAPPTVPVAAAPAATPANGTTAAPPSAGQAAPLPPLNFDVAVYRQRSPVLAALQRYVPDVGHSLRNAVAGALLLLALAWAPARALARAPRVRTATRAFVLLPLAFPSLLLGMAHEQLFLSDDGLGDRIYRGWGLVALTFAARFLPLAVVGLAAAWRRIAPEIEEASDLAPIGGAARLLKLRLPLLLPALLAVGTLAFGLMMREFDAIVLLPAAQEMLTSRIYSLVHYAKDAVVGALTWLQFASILVPWIALKLLLAPRRR